MWYLFLCLLFQEVEKYAKLVDSIQYNSQKVGMILFLLVARCINIIAFVDKKGKVLLSEGLGEENILTECVVDFCHTVILHYQSLCEK